jgi:DeoR/GlpR family transcriptional regulator of sugar metabolism
VTNEPQLAFAEERRQRIVDQVTRDGRVRIADLARTLGVTEPTIRKDLARLEREHLLQRTHGGAITPIGGEPDFNDRKIAQPEAKTAIATACVGLIERGASVFLDSGTTVLRIAELLPNMPLNVLTSGLAAATAVGDKSGVRHTLLGGQVRPAGGSVSGPLAVENLHRFTMDIAFIGVTGVTADGVTVADFAEAQLKREVIGRSRRVVVALDATKVGAVDYATVSSLDAIDTIVTLNASEQLQQLCADANVELIDAA